MNGHAIGVSEAKLRMIVPEELHIAQTGKDLTKMKSHEIEAWAIRVIGRVESGQPNEDSRVELKRCWPKDESRTARQIAAHANAAQGEPILWLIGIDEKTGVTGAQHAELSVWHAKVRSHFEGLAPQLVDLNIPWKGKTLVAFLFETDRVPFVVKNPVFNTPAGGPVEFEVPWREGTSTRSAKRNDLLKLLEPLHKLPTLEILGADLSAWPTKDSTDLTWALRLEVYIIPKSDRQLALPFHRSRASFELQSIGRFPFEHLFFSPANTGPQAGSEQIKGAYGQLLVSGPGIFAISGRNKTPAITNMLPDVARVNAELFFAGLDGPVSLSENLIRSGPQKAERPSWIFKK